MRPYRNHLNSSDDLVTTYEAIRAGFVALALEKKPHTFFIGAAIEKKMSTEIWGQLESGVLSNAANLTDENQVVSISKWLCSL